MTKRKRKDGEEVVQKEAAVPESPPDLEGRLEGVEAAHDTAQKAVEAARAKWKKAQEAEKEAYTKLGRAKAERARLNMQMSRLRGQ